MHTEGQFVSIRQWLAEKKCIIAKCGIGFIESREVVCVPLLVFSLPATLTYLVSVDALQRRFDLRLREMGR